MRYDLPFLLLLGAGSTAAVLWAVVLGPPLLHDIRERRPTVVICSLYLFGLAPAASAAATAVAGYSVLDSPVGRTDYVTRVATLVLIALVAFTVVGTLISRDVRLQVRGAGVLLLYGVALGVSGIALGQASQQAWLLVGTVLVVSNAQVPMLQLVTHLRYILRFTTAGSLAMLAVAYDAVVFEGNSRTFLGVDQLAGVTTHPNVLGPLAALTLGLELAHGSRKRSITGVALAVIAIVLSQSQLGLVAAALVVLTYWTASLGLVLKVVYGLVGVAAVFPILWFTLVSDPLRLLSSMYSLNNRAYIWDIAWNRFSGSEFFLGVGPDAFGVAARNSSVAFASIAGQAHNQLLQSAAQLGWLGVALMVWLVVVLTGAAASGRRSGEWLPMSALLVLLASFVTESPIRSSLTGQAFMVIVVVLLVGSDGRNQSSEKKVMLFRGYGLQ